MSTKYLLFMRSTPDKRVAPSPTQMQEMYAAFTEWKDKFKDNIVDMGGKLKAGGKILSANGVTDGPLVEAKEIVGGFMTISADSYAQAVEIAKGCPGLIGPGTSVEIREMAAS